MSELDFDELDKAVNTLMSDVPKVEPPKTDDVKTLTIQSTLSDTDKPALGNLDAALTKINTDTKLKVTVAEVSPSRSTTSAVVATRRGGRFMDVVHPSSNMKTSTSGTNTNTAASRQGVTIEPAKPVTTGVSVEEPKKPVDNSEAIENTPVVDVVTTGETGTDAIQRTKNTSGNDWPDPLDMSGYDAQPETKPTPPPAKITDEAVVLTVDETEPDTTRPLDSPFLTGTKVEKRPLGGAATQDDLPAEEPGHAPVLGSLAGENADHPEAHNQLPAHPNDIETQLPPELQSDLMAIETDGDTAASVTPQAAINDEVIQQSEQKTAVKEAVRAETATPTMPQKKESAAAGPMSIAQQYREEPTTSDQSSGSIYDTDSYHQPLTHPAKHSSGWLWVIWISLLLLVGGSGAMALYMLDII